MNTKWVLVLDLHNQGIKLPPRGNRWNWFAERGIKTVKMYGAQLPEGIDTIRVFPTLSALAIHTDGLHIARRNVVFVSDDERALKRARDEWQFSRIAVSPAPAELGDCASTSCATTADLAGLMNLLLENLKSRTSPVLPEVSPGPPSSEK
ncbi:MAG: hypothetical protein HYW91_02535 [Candidatus Sungbacteria bacterium]|nr:hypothetical protein [Candidatus Sungbacteria bacterium]